MHPQITNIQASAQDAFEHIFASAGALVFVNEYSGLPLHRLPLMPSQNTSSHVPGHNCITRWESTHAKQETHEAFVAFVGLDWADAKHDVCLHAAGSAKREHFILEHTPEAIEAWVGSLRQRCAGKPIAICLELNTGPIVFALRTYDFLVLFPVHPLTLARYREAFTPSRAKDAPTDAERQLAWLCTHRDKPGSPSHRRAPHARPGTTRRTPSARGRGQSAAHPSSHEHPKKLFPSGSPMVSGQRHAAVL